MINILFIPLFIIVFIVLFLTFLKCRRNTRLGKNSTIISKDIHSLKELQFNPDISTDNWELHKLRLAKFRRSQYKGLTFFVSPENRIYYLSEKGAKVYC